MSPAAAQTVQVPDLSGEPDQEGRKLLAFLADLDTGSASALSNMLLVYGGAMLLLGGVILVWSSVSAATDTASEGRWKFRGKEALRIAVAFLLMVPFLGGLSGGQHIALAFGAARRGHRAADLERVFPRCSGRGEPGGAGARAAGDAQHADVALPGRALRRHGQWRRRRRPGTRRTWRSGAGEHVQGVVERGAGITEVRRRSLS